jgi:hypothetical protein
MTRAMAKFVAGDGPISEHDVIEHVEGFSPQPLNRSTKPAGGKDLEAKRQFLEEIQRGDA